MTEGAKSEGCNFAGFEEREQGLKARKAANLWKLVEERNGLSP